MFKIRFGTIWLAIMSFITYVIVDTPDALAENGILVIIFLGIFWLIGIAVLVDGIKQVVKDKKTDKYGVETYAIITDIDHTGNYANNRPELKAIMSVLDNDYGGVNTYEEVIGFQRNKYRIGDYLLVKHYEEDINIIKKIPAEQVPEPKRNALTREAGISNRDINHQNNNTATTTPNRRGEKEVVIIDGREYIKN